MSNNQNFSNLSNSELLIALNTMLTTKQIETIGKMTIGLNLKLIELDKFKDSLIRVNKDVALEAIQDRLANALAVVKDETGSSLSLQANGKLNIIGKFLTDKAGTDAKNFMFMASMVTEHRDMELMLINATFQKIIELSDTMFDNLTPDMVLEVKRRVTGIKSVDASDDALLAM